MKAVKLRAAVELQVGLKLEVVLQPASLKVSHLSIYMSKSLEALTVTVIVIKFWAMSVPPESLNVYSKVAT